MSVSKTPTADLPQVDPPSQTNWRRKGGSRKMPKRRARRINSRHEDEEIVSTDDYGDITNPENDVSSWMRPGAVSVGGIATRLGRSSTQETTASTGQLGGDSVLVTDPGTPFERPIDAVLVPHDDVIVDAKVEGDDASTFCVFKKRTLLLLLGILALLIMIGGVVGGVLTAIPKPAPRDLLEELLLLNATFETDLWRFEDPETPQYQALEWIKTDTIVMSSGRSTLDLLQRYVLAVLIYSTHGPKWGSSRPYLSSNDVCSWNKGSEDSGVYCRLDGESIDELKFWSNQLTGTIPTELGQLISLEYLSLGNNRLTGTIPTELGQLVSLTSLQLGLNQLTGTIPTELGQLLSLEYLWVEYIQLTGTIPTDLGQLLSLHSLVMDSNQFTGTIPTELGQLVSLNDLSLNNNQLTGTIPSELAGARNLAYAYFDENALTGSMETFFCVETRTWDRLRVDCDEVECSCCECE